MKKAAAASAPLMEPPEYLGLIGRRDTDKLALAEPGLDVSREDRSGRMPRFLAESARR